MQTIYCIPGLGADEGVFKNLDLSFAKPVFIPWLQPLHHEPLSKYAARLQQEFIGEPHPIILGLSLGGMIATEISISTPSAKTIIISSAKTTDEIPYYWKFFRYLPVYKILPQWSIKKSSGIQYYFLGATSASTKRYVDEAIKNANTEFYRWAVGAIISWQNKTVPLNVTHIHGLGDKILPLKYVKPDITVNNGGHLMIMEKALEISTLIKQVCCP